MGVIFLVAGFILFVLLVVAHEYGHFLAAKRGDVEVEEFGIGFPPKIIGKTMGKGIFRSYYTLNWLPLGGFVRLKGENTQDKRPGSFGAASFSRKVKIMLAGVAVNAVIGIVLMSVVAAIALPVVIDNQFTVESDTTVVTNQILVGQVQDGSPAASAGIEPGADIIEIANVQATSIQDVSQAAERNAGQTVEISYKPAESNIVRSEQLTLAENPEDGESYLGVGLSSYQERRSTWSAPIVGTVVSGQIAWESLVLVGNAITDLFSGDLEQAAAAGVSGPVGIIYVFTQIDSISILLFVIALISIGLALMNTLPIPALDGGRLAVTGLFRAFNKPLNPDVENAIHGTGMAFLLILFALITVVDVGRIF